MAISRRLFVVAWFVTRGSGVEVCVVIRGVLCVILCVSDRRFCGIDGRHPIDKKGYQVVGSVSWLASPAGYNIK